MYLLVAELKAEAAKIELDQELESQEQVVIFGMPYCNIFSIFCGRCKQQR